jgi:hypothetical protein
MAFQVCGAAHRPTYLSFRGFSRSAVRPAIHHTEASVRVILVLACPAPEQVEPVVAHVHERGAHVVVGGSVEEKLRADPPGWHGLAPRGGWDVAAT